MRNIFILLAVIFLAAGCQKEELNVAVTSPKGDPGLIGYSSLEVQDPKTNSIIHFVDFNRDGKFTPDLGPKKDSVQFVVMNNGQKIVPIPGTKCFNIIQVTGLQETIVGQICSIKGDNGYNPVFSSTIARNLLGDTIGYNLNIFWDVDNNGMVTDPDKLVHTTPMVKNGKDGNNGLIGPMGPMGPMGPSPTIDWDIQITANSIIYLSTINGVTKSKTIDKPVGQTGDIGNTPSLIVTQAKDGAYYLWFDDKNHNGVCDQGEKILEYFVPSNGGLTIVSLTFFKDFIGQSSTQTYEASGWKFQNSGVSDGLGYISGTGSITIPEMRDSLDLLSITIKRGSSIGRLVEVFAIMKDHSKKLIVQKTFEGVSGLKTDEYNKFDLLGYYADLEKLDESQFRGMIAVEVKSTPVGKCVPTDELIKNITVNFRDNHTGK